MNNDTKIPVDPNNPEVRADVPSTEVPTVLTQEDYEAKIAVLENEKQQIAAERDNYKTGMLKAKGKLPSDEILPEDETEEERVRRIVREETATRRISEIDAQKEALTQKALKENKELKLALANKGHVPAADTTSTESTKVQDTLITPEQLKYFKEVLKWDDKKIEHYKKNVIKRS